MSKTVQGAADWISAAPFEDIHIVVPSIQTYQIVDDESTLFGYVFADLESNSGHFIQMPGSLSEGEWRSRMLRMACHFMVDMAPAAGLEELIEKASEIREYYCSLANWNQPAISEARASTIDPIIVSYEREPFFYSEE